MTAAGWCAFGLIYIMVGMLLAIVMDEPTDTDRVLFARVFLWPVFPLVGLLIVLLSLRKPRKSGRARP